MTESSAILSAVPRPAENRHLPDHAALMELYDANYHCLLALCPSLRNPALQIHQYLDDSLPDMPTLQLEFHDHTRHTATFGLACRWDDAEKADLLPDVQVRLYRDSRQAELLGHRGFPLISSRLPEGSLQVEWLHRRHAGNRFLFNWLRYCLRQGYHLAKDSGRTS